MTSSRDAAAGLLFRPGAVVEDEPVPAPAPPPPARSRVGTVVCLVLGLLAVLRVVVAAVRLPPLPAESRIVDGAFATIAGLPVPADGPGEVAARLQLTAHAALTGAFGRYPDVLGGARELAVVAFVVLLVAVAVVAGAAARPGAFAALLALFVLAEPAVVAVATLGPGLLGATWLAVGAALLVQRATPVRVAGAVAVVAGVLTAPPLIVAVVLALAVVAARDLPTAALAVASVAAVLGGTLLLVGPATEGRVHVPLLVAAAALAVVGIVRGRRRAAAALVGVGLLVVALPGDVALPLLVATLLVVGTQVVDDLRVPGGVVPLAAAAGTGLAAVVLPAAWSGPGPDRPHRALATWIGTATEPGAVLTVPPGVWSDLVRDGVPARRLGPAGTLVVVEGTSTAQDRLARFSNGSTQLTVSPATPVTAVPEGAARARAGAQLDANPRFDAPDDVRAVIRTGGVDARALLVLGGLAGRTDVTVTALPVVAGEDPARPRHQVVLGGADPAAVDVLRAQQAPFAPLITGTPDALVLTWTLPAPSAVFGR
ncbi:hypothetical protein GCM10017691_24320 [Pseudonocardia petroleophila]|uniref:Dolichyl-phosphate-mannose-protein mannosyltransferase n=1 Tax=Pseudonocardia petroleophila TaxID=37331 RepID=A0A7G7MFR7_9PSEU|nr:hypothetical protein [Pseudonocardia petroleophila]QNG51628.1 hypothetical protein H6H00_26560 [Pseudonocardia petroleophila]